ncbi:nodulation protein NodN [Mesorhizobium sp. L-8-10]|uniref:MaoC family dehydratase n=1 Tax=Mesorhizobium sp. L-8-10 TaxID=2744523 RepID=UPI001928AB51|nr:MaoC family dehydratase [Mesorhizobium sp. L-8-10]BCH29769.1 nodulation protein NodN [Mesorhizobium sp. L-8-10]
MTATIAAAELQGRVGQEIGVSDWVEVDQSMIDMFADATKDHQFIHVNPERARTSPFGGTIAHGFLTLSLLSHMYYDALPRIENIEMGVNYGMNRLRFLAPVKAGERVRGRFVLRDVTSNAANQILTTYDVTVEIEGADKPALIAEWLTLAVLADTASADA